MSSSTPPTVGVFKLSPQEAFIFGVSQRGGQLRFGPSGSRLMMAVATAVIGLLGGLLFAWAPDGTTINGGVIVNRTPAIIAGALIIVGTFSFAALVWRSGVVADTDGLLLRQGRRVRRVPWTAVEAVGSYERNLGRARFLANGSSVGFSNRYVGSWSVGVVTIRPGGNILLPGLVAAGRDEGLSLGEPTAAEVKAAALRRYGESVTGRALAATTPISTARSLGGPGRGRQFIEQFLFLASIYALNAWAVANWTVPKFVFVLVVATGWSALKGNGDGLRTEVPY